MAFATSTVALQRLKRHKSSLSELRSFGPRITVCISFYRLGTVIDTCLGGFWDFTSDLSKGDTAYTSLAIGPHTDTTYFTDPAGLQMFHLLSHTDGEGGMSGLFDGFAAAQYLFQAHPNFYRTLAYTDVHCHASGNDGISIQPATGFPVLCHDGRTGHLHQIRWNPADKAGVDISMTKMIHWYSAAK